MESSEKKTEPHRLTEDELVDLMSDDDRFKTLDQKLDRSGFEMSTASTGVDENGNPVIRAKAGRFGYRRSCSPVWTDSQLGLVTTTILPAED